MPPLAKTLLGALVAVLAFLVLGGRIMLDLIGYTTAADDAALLQQRAPAAIDWLLSTPWWVPALLMLALVALAAWLLVSGTKEAAAEGVAEGEGLSEARVKELIEEVVARNPKLDVEAIEALIGKQLSEHTATKLQAEFATHSQLHSHDEALLELKNQTKFIRGLAESAREAGDQKLKAAEGAIQQLRHDLTDRLQWIDDGFAAIFHRERLHELNAAIDEDADKLLRVSRGEIIENWGRWNHWQQAFRDKVDRWLELADFYRSNCTHRVLDVPQERLEGEWEESDDLFPNSSAIIAYRTVSIIYENQVAEREPVENCVRSAAYARPSKKGREPRPPINVD